MPYTDEMYDVRCWGSITDGDERPPSHKKRSRKSKKRPGGRVVHTVLCKSSDEGSIPSRASNFNKV
jgi:hypothetical protein